MEAYQLVHEALEPSEGSPPDNAKVRIITPEGTILDIVATQYEEDGNVLWLQAEISE